jgi:hypothetical protein
MHKRSSSRAASTKDRQEALPQTSSSSCASEIVAAGAKFYALISETTTIANEALEGKTSGELSPR